MAFKIFMVLIVFALPITVLVDVLLVSLDKVVLGLAITQLVVLIIQAAITFGKERAK